MIVFKNKKIDPEHKEQVQYFAELMRNKKPSKRKPQEKIDLF